MERDAAPAFRIVPVSDVNDVKNRDARPDVDVGADVGADVSAERCQECGRTRTDAEGGVQTNTGRPTDDKVSLSLEANLSPEQVLQLRHLLKRLRDERWHAMQAATNDRDKVLRTKARLRETREDVRALHLALSALRRAVNALQLDNNRHMRMLADHFRNIMASLVAGMNEREKAYKDATIVDQLEVVIAELKSNCENQTRKLAEQGVDNERLSTENKQLKKDQDKQQIIYKSRDQVAKQKISNLQKEAALLRAESETLRRDLRTAARSLQTHQGAQRVAREDAEQIEECKLNLEKGRLNLENAIRERDLYEDRLNTTKGEYEERLKKNECKHKGELNSQEAKNKEIITELEKKLEAEKKSHNETLTKYMSDFRNNEMQQAGRFKQKHDKAQTTIKTLEEQLAVLREAARQKEASLREEMERVRRDKPTDVSDVQDIQEFKFEIERLNSLVARECEERLELSQALEESRMELLSVKTGRDGDYEAGSQTARHLTHDVTGTVEERSLYKSRWRSEPSLVPPSGPLARPALQEAGGPRPREKRVLHANCAHAVSADDLVADTAERAHFLPPIPQTHGTTSSDHVHSQQRQGLAAFHPNKEGFRLPKPIDYLRSHQQETRHRQQQIVSRIFRQTAAASTAAHQRAALTPLPERGPQRHPAEIEVAHASSSVGRITVRIPNPYDTVDDADIDEALSSSPYAPNNSPASPAARRPAPPRAAPHRAAPSPDPGGGPEPRRSTSRRTAMDYDFSAAKSSELVHVTRSRDSGEARRRVMQLLNERDGKSRHAYTWGY